LKGSFRPKKTVERKKGFGMGQAKGRALEGNGPSQPPKKGVWGAPDSDVLGCRGSGAGDVVKEEI